VIGIGDTRLCGVPWQTTIYWGAAYHQTEKPVDKLFEKMFSGISPLPLPPKLPIGEGCGGYFSRSV